MHFLPADKDVWQALCWNIDAWLFHACCRYY